MSKRRKKRKQNFIIAFALIVFIGSGSIIAIQLYQKIFGINVNPDGFQISVPTDSKYEELLVLLEKTEAVIDIQSFDWVAKRKNLPKHVYPGFYKVEGNISNNDLVNILRSGSQTPIKLIFNNIRTLEQLAGRVSKSIEPDSTELADLFLDKEIHEKFGFNKHTFISLFIPNTYEFYWNTNTSDFLKRMEKEYKAFWNSERIQKANQLNLSYSEVATLASIVEEETLKNDEKPKIAGVYLNRLKKGMLLQADPTVKFAIGDFSIRRIRKKNLKIDSPYNTYKYKGLPPGPIRIPSISSIDAVLNADKHSYLYFCAKEDFSGYHSFANTYVKHLQNARRYQKALNKRKIYN